LADDNDEDDEEGSKEDDEDLTVLQSILDISHGFGSDARPGGANGLVGAGAESFAQTLVASSPLRGPSPKRPCATTNDGQGSSHVAPICPSTPGSETLVMDAAEHRPSLEILEGETQTSSSTFSPIRWSGLLHPRPFAWDHQGPGMPGPLEIMVWRRLVLLTPSGMSRQLLAW
jgi:hypothetical protein